jgi:hypothetical protein
MLPVPSEVNVTLVEPSTFPPKPIDPFDPLCVDNSIVVPVNVPVVFRLPLALAFKSVPAEIVPVVSPEPEFVDVRSNDVVAEPETVPPNVPCVALTDPFSAVNTTPLVPLVVPVPLRFRLSFPVIAT